MAPNKTRNAGRQLLILRNRMKALEDHAKMPLLRRREAGLLLELGQRDEAVAVATSLAEMDENDGSSLAFLADMLASTCRWGAAEEKFTAAAKICAETGRKEKATALFAGPVFLLAEARGDYKTCWQVAPFPLLRNRALRLAGEKQRSIDEPAESPWRELFLLEKVHAGGDISLLSGILHHWKAGEAEWRWRILFEGAFLEYAAGKVSRQWTTYLRETGNRVLDPRYTRERKAMKKLIRGHFVNINPQ